ncbi:MAG: hypothetical protein K0R57_4006 [Paenibacillaceae bacterium]|jgi:hypothetical protein|nr:hypothetical protein [Paenibacillaceae bacterium]
MDLKELIKLAKGLEGKDKQQLSLPLQSGTNLQTFNDLTNKPLQRMRDLIFGFPLNCSAN